MHLGIHIDTHVAQAAYLDETGNPHLLRLQNGKPFLPAVVRQTMHGLLIGEPVARSIAGNSETTVSGCVRLMGRSTEFPAVHLDQLPYKVRQINGDIYCNLLYDEVRASDIYGYLVKTLVDSAQATLNRPVTGVVLTVPASAEDRFRVQAKSAVEAQGVQVRRLINQPTASLLAANLPARLKKIAVIYCGGGSTDISIAHRNKKNIQILTSAGDMALGGDDLVWTVAEQLNQRFLSTAQIDAIRVGHSQLAAFGLRSAAKTAIEQLAIASEMALTIDHGGGFGRDLTTIIQRPHLEYWLHPYLARMQQLAEQALADSSLSANDIDGVLLTGTWVHLPLIQQAIADVFARPVSSLMTDTSAEWSAYGAALAGANTSQTIWDVTPYPLGINCYYGDTEYFSPIIAANAVIPTPGHKSRKRYAASYQTRDPDQTSVTLNILQYRGDQNPDPDGPTPVRPDQCELLGSWHFAGLRPRNGRRAAFTVTFVVDQDGILSLYAKETATGHSLEATVDRGIG